MKKRLISLLLTIALALSVTACGSKSESPNPAPADEPVQSDPAPADDVSAPAAATDPAEEPDDSAQTDADTSSKPDSKDQAKAPTASNGIMLVHASAIDGATFLALEEKGTAVVRFSSEDENTTIDHWEFNGKPVEAGDDISSIEIPLTEAGALVAVLRPVDKVEGINCHLQFLDKNGFAAGEEYTELNFEQDYENPVIGETCEGGMISLCVTAEVPENQTVDYWLINGVEYDFGDGMLSFYVRNLDEATVYEPVFKDVEIEEEPAATTPTVTVTTPDPHQHSFYMAYNSEQHWLQCNCGETENHEEHQWVETTEPLGFTAGIWSISTCSVCGYTVKSQIIY